MEFQLPPPIEENNQRILDYLVASDEKFLLLAVSGMRTEPFNDHIGPEK